MTMSAQGLYGIWIFCSEVINPTLCDLVHNFSKTMHERSLIIMGKLGVNSLLESNWEASNI